MKIYVSVDQDLPDDVIDEAIKEGTLSDKIRGVITLFIAHIVGIVLLRNV